MSGPIESVCFESIENRRMHEVNRRIDRFEDGERGTDDPRIISIMIMIANDARAHRSVLNQYTAGNNLSSESSP